MEFWNHVFTEFYRNEDGSFTALPQRNIDTGMGLERLTVVVQGVQTVYETDLFGPILEAVEELAGQRSQSAAERAQDWRNRVVADHSRAVAFMIIVYLAGNAKQTGILVFHPLEVKEEHP